MKSAVFAFSHMVAASALFFALACPFQSSARCADANGAAVVGCGDAKLVFNALGEIASLEDLSTGRELLRKALPMFTVGLEDGRTAVPSSRRIVSEGRFEYHFPGGVGKIVLECRPFFGGWTFEIVSADLSATARDVSFGQVSPRCVKYAGTLVNGLSDDDDGVVLRAYGWRPRMVLAGETLKISSPAAELPGIRFGLVGGARKDMPRRLRAMTYEAGLAHSLTGGGWSLGSERNRSSYYMLSRPTEATADDWIDAAVRCGSTTLHFDWWWLPHKAEGHYPVRTDLFPRALAGLRDTCFKAQAAGLYTDMHTLSGCIGFEDSWVTPHASSNLMWKYRYTLDRPLGEEDDVVYVREKPGEEHDFEVLYSSNGNVLRIGTELMQYKGLSRTKPYRFTGVSRGVFGTEKKSHADGAIADYVYQHYLSFFAEPESPLADELAGRLADVYHACGFDQVYLDGAEGVGFDSKAKIDLLLRKLFKAFAAKGRAPLWEDSRWTTHAWWFHSRIGSWDYPHFGFRRFVDRHLKFLLPQSRMANYLEPSLGWWSLRSGKKWLDDYVRGPYLDEHEYFIGKTAAADSAVSLRHGSTDISKNPFPLGEMRSMTVIGWYERFRLARAFTAEALRRLAVPGDDYRLRQNEIGEWTLTPLKFHEHRISGPDLARWNITSEEERSASLRVAALYGIEPYDSKAAVPAISAADVPAMKTTAALGMKFDCRASDGEKGRSILLTAENTGAPERGSWASAALEFDYPYTSRVFTGCNAFGFWVKGDASGAVLNVQLCRPRPDGGGINEHIVKLDFSGWRYVAFTLTREADVDKSCVFDWPYMTTPQSYQLFERGFAKPERIGRLALWLNGVPRGGRAEVEVGEVRALPIRPLRFEKTAVVLNGVRHELPFPLEGGEYAELSDGYWTRYSMSAEMLERRAAAAPAPRVAAGGNAVRFEGRTEEGTLPRAEVTVITAGRPFPATVGNLREDQEKLLSYEAHMPEKWAPAAGFDRLSPLKVKPGKEARLEIEIVGPVARPALTIGNVKRVFGADIARNEKLVMKDGVNWVVRGPCGAVRLRGRCADALPAFRGVNQLSMSSSDPGGASAQLRIIKRMDGCGAMRTVPVVTLTFDDNPKGHYTIAAPVLERYGFRGTFNIVIDRVGGDGRKMNWDEIRDLRRRGHEIASHTASHKNLPALYAEKGESPVMRELAVSRDVIRRETGSAPRFLCHPFVQSSSEVDSAVRSAGMTPMLLCRHNFGTGTTPETFAGFLDGLIAGKTEKADILFHGITKETGGWRPLASAADFEGCIAVLAEYARKGRIRVVDYATFSGQGRGTLCLTFDDRSFDNWVAAIPVFREYGARASFFASGELDGRALAALKRLYEAGHTVGPHTVNHLSAPDTVKRDGFDAYWEKEIAPQMQAFASVGIFPRAMAYPNNSRDAATDAGFVARGMERLRAGVRGARPYDPKGLKKAKIIPFPELDAMYFGKEHIRTNALMGAAGIGSAYRTDIDDLCAGLRRAAACGETVVFFSHDISENPNGIGMRLDWLKQILSTARTEGMDILGFDDLGACQRKND